MTQLYLIRHGQALTEVDGILNDYGLTERGVKQAEHLRDRLAGSGEIAADVLIASTFPRAKQTAEIIAPALGLPIIFDDEVQEMRPGSMIGIHITEFREKYGRYDTNDDPFLVRAAGAESWSQFVLRAATSLDRIINQYEGKTIVVVCHGGIIDNSFTYFFGLSFLRHSESEVRFHTENTSITYWRKLAADSGEGEPARWRLIRYNDDFHLRDLDVKTNIPWSGLRVQQQVEQEQQPGESPQEE